MHPFATTLDGKKQFVPCGKCNFCLESRRNEWTFRLRMEMNVSHAAHFITLTYDDNNIVYSEHGHPTLVKRDLQLFTKRLRKEQDSHTDLTLRYYSVGEYGTTTLRPHYHSIMFNLIPEVCNKLTTIWGKGQLMVGTVTPASIHYVTKYHVNRVGEYADRAPPILNHVQEARSRCKLH